MKIDVWFRTFGIAALTAVMWWMLSSAGQAASGQSMVTIPLALNGSGQITKWPTAANCPDDPQIQAAVQAILNSAAATAKLPARTRTVSSYLTNALASEALKVDSTQIINSNLASLKE